MRHKVSLTLEEDLIIKINETIARNRIFRSKSHVVEEALRNYLDNIGGEK